MQSLFTWLLTTFVIAPAEAEINARLQKAGAPAAIIRDVQVCVTTATPILVERAGSDWIWGVRTVIGVATGYSDAKQVLSDIVPICRPTMEAVKPFLQDGNKS
jgi:hypothetical protein